ncbi:syntaxin 1B-like protein [Reticulomyxa filosa]|uniref:Syntaxin 1B-like protein n=1 Tax=Reticulomyxa filosa TaxID=46433 RepID=X6P4N7_RETFI|nr:syntaxin 1B-like protein [Reticulomyxa filosa]|eukprot:ETO33039.1 syntaxin 1B-like protein [Reticulomyxa filosa]
MNDTKPNTYMDVFQDIKQEIEKIDDNCSKVDSITARLVKATSNADEKEVITQLNKLMAGNSKIVQLVKIKLKEQKLANDKFCLDKPGSSVAQWRINQLNSCTRRFQVSNIKQIPIVAQSFQLRIKKPQKRHIGHIAQDKISEEEIDNLVSDPAKAQTFIQQSFQIVDIGDAMVDRLAEIESRTEGMQKIYDSLEELRSMWHELNFLISEQQEYLDSIENNVLQTKDYVAQATVHLQEAEKSQKKARKVNFIPSFFR